MRHVKQFTGVVILLMALHTFMAFAPRPKTFTIDTDTSSATWRWHSASDQHSGTVYVSSGELLADNAEIKGGTVNVDLNSLMVSTVRDLQQNSLVTGWMKGREFFDTYKHPVAVFKLVSVRHDSGNSYTLNGLLTIKGKTQPARVPAVISFQKKRIDITVQLIVDPSKFGITSGSKDEIALRNQASNNEFRLRLHLVAKR